MRLRHKYEVDQVEYWNKQIIAVDCYMEEQKGKYLLFFLNLFFNITSFYYDFKYHVFIYTNIK